MCKGELVLYKGRVIFRFLLSLVLAIGLIIGTLACAPSTGATNETNGSSAITSTSEVQSNQPAQGQVNIYALDIGQGDAFLLKVGNQYTMIDTGDVDHRTSLVKQLKALGVTELENVIITHPHADHLGGFYALAQNFKIHHVYDNGVQEGSSVYRTYIKTLKRLGLTATVLHAGMTLNFGNGALYTVYAPWNEIIKTKSGKVDQNNNSIVGKLTFGKFSMLFTGDAEQAEENRLIKEDNTKLSARILKVGHHGSNGSSQKDFIRSVRPEIGIISCGLYNSYGHPGSQSLKRLQAEGVKIYRTDTMGTIHIETDGKTWQITTSR